MIEVKQVGEKLLQVGEKLLYQGVVWTIIARKDASRWALSQGRTPSYLIEDSSSLTRE